MSKERMESNWERVRTQILSVWGELDEKDMKKARGDLNQMVSLIHDTTGEDRALIMQKMATLV
ncbi:MAG: general stress protein CsbD [Bacteroidetes bacterium]|nr:general stress protein CsbD [Bacteroidota bacterium]